MKTRILTVLGVALAVIFLMTLIPSQSNAQQNVIQLKLVGGQAPGHPMSQIEDHWAKLLEERTKGRVKVTLYQLTLGKVTDFFDMVREGTVDVTNMGSGWAGGRLPIMEVVDLPFEIADVDTAGKVLSELYARGLLKELESFKVLWLHATNTGNLFLRNKKVTTLEQMAGLKIRPIPGVSQQLVEALKAVPVAVRTPDLYMAMDKGEIDGFFSGPDNVTGDKLYETFKYQLQIPTFNGAWAMLMNKNTWNKLPPDIQNIVTQVNKETYDFYHTFMHKQGEDSAKILKGKVEVYSLSAAEEARWRKAAEPVTNKWIADMEAKGLPGKKAVETMREIVAKSKKK
jgi:TRAP-type transport system periplasmic protein